MADKYVYSFGSGQAEGNAKMKELLGGKGANLAEMTNLGLPVPPGFTISTEMCNEYFESGGKLPDSLIQEVKKAMRQVERIMGRKFGDKKNPLLVSVRSGARQSMPGMMDTVLNVGLSTETLPGLIEMTGGDERFAYDAYRRLIMMYADVVMEKAAGIEPERDDLAVRARLEDLMDGIKEAKGYATDRELTAEDLKILSMQFKATVRGVLGQRFPDDPWEQLWGGIRAVFQSWIGKRAVSYRNIEGIPHNWGTAVNVQTMVFGNLDDDSATGVAFTRDPSTGENVFYGEWLRNAQGEDVVAGIRTPNALNLASKREGSNDHLASLEEEMSELYDELSGFRTRLETHYRDMQDLEFTIERGRLWMLQTRVGKRNGVAAVRMAVDMVNEKMISREEALLRIKPSQLDELLHPMLDPAAEREAWKLAKGLPAGPGGAVGRIVLDSDKAKRWAEQGRKVILVRTETSPEDVDGMKAAEGILTSRGGMTSHAALVARGWGKCCIAGASDLKIDYRERSVTTALGTTLNEGDWISLNGSTGIVYQGQLAVMAADPEKMDEYNELMSWADEIRRLGIRTNADNPNDAAQARRFGAKGIGLCRTEHMFFGEERIRSMRAMILAKTEEERVASLKRLLPFQREDFYQIMKAMSPFPVNIRLVDPPLHEFLPDENDPEAVQEVADEMEVDAGKLSSRIHELRELNPMLGHRGCRLGITIPAVTEMQARAILEATAKLTLEGVEVHPEIMVPLVGNYLEFENQRDIIMKTAEQVKKSTGCSELHFKVGTMIEVPRAAITADEIAPIAQFFSFGTNDLTQMGCGFSRDDSATFLPHYLEAGIYQDDPFQSIDQKGVGQLVRIAVEKGRAANKDLHLGICGEHGGDPASIEFFDEVGLDYVSCSPFRVPIARLAAAQSTLRHNGGPKPVEDAPKAGTAAKKAAPAKKTAAKKPAARKTTANPRTKKS
ncbi:pyruvate, phosphate dikinase [bacterium]|nr:pyruvate, phosphate dikinase [bacterium]